MPNNIDHNHPRRLDAGKDPEAVRQALTTLTRQTVDILRNYGAPVLIAENAERDIKRIWQAALFDVEHNR